MPDKEAALADVRTPSMELMEAIAADRDLKLSAEQLAEARDFLVRYWGELNHLRAVELEFLPPHIEPQTALRWIENGGRSRSAS